MDERIDRAIDSLSRILRTGHVDIVLDEDRRERCGEDLTRLRELHAAATDARTAPPSGMFVDPQQRADLDEIAQRWNLT